MSSAKSEKGLTAMVTENPSRILPVPRLSTILAVVVIGFFIWAFLTRKTLQFYASFVFLFYSVTKSMWVSVILLGIFQTILMIPFRVINLIKSANIKDFEATISALEAEKDQAGFLKQSVKGGRQVALYYMVNFFIQVISYVSIGRLFLIDFYSKPLDPELLYRFVPYPDYPILDRMFKIPYIWFNNTIDLGMKWVWWVWIILIGLQALLMVGRSVSKTIKRQAESVPVAALGKWGTKLAGSTFLLMVVIYILLRHLPVDWEFRIFTGDVAFPNRKFNALTAIVTTLTLIWVNIPKITKKVELAKNAGILDEVVWRTEKQLFRETIQAAILVGLGAYFITNLIPCAFELSVFTLEVISLLSPLTLDKIILGTVKTKPVEEGLKAKNEIEKIKKPMKIEGEIKF